MSFRMGSYLRFYIFSCLTLLSSGVLYATHYRAGEITYETIGQYQIKATITVYAKWSSPSDLADRDSVIIDWGDGSNSTIPRINGNPGGQDLGNDIHKSIYVGIHTYSGPPPNRFYLISFYDQNRIGGILNMENSINVPFYVEDTVKFLSDPANIGFDSSPLLLNPPIDYGAVGQVFTHNPAAYDPDGDSLEFTLVPCRQLTNTQVPLYSYPDDFCRSIDPLNSMEIDRRTGQLTWSTPCRAGVYNIAILVREFREGVLMGTLIRDMQIIVLSVSNRPPQLSQLVDTCIRAGAILRDTIRASDLDVGQRVTIKAFGGPFEVNSSPATTTSQPANPASMIFNWNTNCSHIRGQEYSVVFKAEDNYTFAGQPAPLTDVQNWQIRVIAPPPQGLTATATNQSVVLNWQSPYSCASSPDFRGFSIWRKSGCDPFTPDYCETGLGGRGYTKISTTNTFNYTYTDLTAVVGQEYSYRVVAHFSRLSPNGLFQFDPSESVASNEACVFMPIDIPVLLNVDVLQTDPVNGQIFVRWAKPLVGGVNLDTIQNPPPYRFDLYRGEGFNFTNPALIWSTPDANSYSALVDTFFTDNGINTTDNPWSYMVFFYSANDTVGHTPSASSVYLNVAPSDQSLILSWNENVPWTNDSFAVFKQNKVTLLYEPIDTVYEHSYIDLGLINDSTYCYFVRSFGHYSTGFFTNPLINNSQWTCGVPVDTTPPCPPHLEVANDCNLYENKPWDASSYHNYLTWFIQQDSCSDDITHYHIYFGSDSASMTLLDSLGSKYDTTFTHELFESLAGCYAVTALDRVGNESALSNVFCIDNCPYYILPNTFTPNGDGQNDIFHPFKPYRFVPKIEMKIFNRWGNQVFETNDPEINWDGRDQKTGKMLDDGVYLYAGYYFEQHQSGLVRKPLSGEKKGGGFIHLITGK